MATLFLVRHGKAAAGFDGHHDPGLDELGARQASATATVLAPHGPIQIYSSPLARARETAEPLVERWGSSAVIIGNVIRNTDDHGIVLRGRCSPIVINNVVADCANGGIAIENSCTAFRGSSSSL